ncbi:MAG: hypothetical protein HDR88_11340 [Bacteroides sp.]|nr:hypothetical protein [Bacteroides sp.]
MKKNLINWGLVSFLFLLGACLTGIIIGCSQQNDVEDQTSSENLAYEELLNSLEIKSNEFFDSHPTTNTRGSIFLKRIWNSVKADVEATFKESTGELAMTFTDRVLTASKKAFNKLEKVKVSYKNGSSRTRHVIDSLLFKYTAITGKYTLAEAHNMVILKMYKEDFNDDGPTVNTIAKARSILLANNLPAQSCTIEESAQIVDDFLLNFLLL